jgi:hypothetical protein
MQKLSHLTNSRDANNDHDVSFLDASRPVYRSCSAQCAGVQTISMGPSFRRQERSKYRKRNMKVAPCHDFVLLQVH